MGQDRTNYVLALWILNCAYNLEGFRRIHESMNSRTRAFPICQCPPLRECEQLILTNKSLSLSIYLSIYPSIYLSTYFYLHISISTFILWLIFLTKVDHSARNGSEVPNECALFLRRFFSALLLDSDNRVGLEW